MKPAQEKKRNKTISRSFLTGLLAIVLVGFAASIGFSWVLQTKLSNENAAELLRINIKDVKQDILDASDKNLLALAREVADALTDGLNTPTEHLAELVAQYDVSEIDLVNAEGIIIACTNPDFVGFDMKSGKQSSEFMVLVDGTAQEVVQNYQPISYDASISRKYAGVKIDDGFVQVGYDAERFQKDVDQAMVGITHNWHVGRGGFILICDRNWDLVSDPFFNEGQNLYVSGIWIDLDTMPEDVIFHQTVYGTPCSCLYGFSEGYLIVSVIPDNEIVLQRDTSVLLSSALEIIVFIALFVMTFLLVRTLVVSNIRKVNDSLSKITEGDLDEVVNVRGSTEFSVLSDDINSTVDTLKRYIAEEAARIDQELEIARAIQLSALPRVFPAFPERTDFDIYASMDPAKEVGGDFYDFFLVDDDHLALVMADVSGKGIPAAMFMMTAKTLIKNRTMAGGTPGEILRDVNSQLCEGNDAELFVTVWLAILELSTGKGAASNAGHEDPVLRRAGGQFELVHYPHSLVIAIMEDVPFEEHTFELHPGDSLFVYTDGVAEATDSHNKLFGTARLLSALNRDPNAKPEDLLHTVRQEIDAFVGDAPQFDDITMLCLHYTGKKEEDARP